VVEKTKANEEAETIRIAIREGTFRQRAVQAQPEPVTPEANTLKQVVELFLERATPKKARDRAAWARDARCRLGKATAFVFEDGRVFGDRLIGSVTEDDLEVFFAALRKRASASTKNHYVQVLGSLFTWATKKGYISRNLMGPESEIRREKPARRSRRLEPGEEDRLLAAAGPRLQRLIVAALETTCRLGELLTLRRRDVDLDRREITIRAENAKDGETRILPISSRLLAILEMAKLDPSGHELKPSAFIFGDGTGEPVTTIKRAWVTCVLRANGHKPRWGKRGKLSPESRAAFRAIGLHFHDLRHEAASRLLEGRFPLHHVQQMLGHASIDTTNTYLNVTRFGLQESMQKLDLVRSTRPTATGQTEPEVVSSERDKQLNANLSVN
jgi:integrase